MPGDRRTLLATLLFTDIVGSSELAEELGDRRWRELLARHHAIVRRELKHFDGRELDTAGDGFFAAFTKPAEAVRCAAAISHGVREVGIEVRAGLHVGEAEAFGDKISGITVHIAARTMALAGPGEVLVTGVLTDLVPGARLGFEDRGARQLKGIPGEWRIFALTTVDGDIRPAPLSEQSRRERLAAIQSPRIPRRVRSPLVSLLGVIVVVGVVVPIALRAGRAHPSTQSGNPSPPPNGKLEVIDPITRKPTTIVPLDFHPGAVAFTEGSLWILDGSENRVVRVDAVSSKVEAQIPVGEDPVGIAIGAGSVWVANASGRSVSRIDPGSNRVAKTITIDFQPAQIAADEHAVWVSEKGIFGPTADAGLATIEPGTDRVIDSTRFHEAPYCPPILGTGSAQGWAADAFGKVRELEPSGKVLPFASSESAVAGMLVDEADGVIWFASDGSPGSVASLDPSSKQFSDRIPVGTTQSHGSGCDPIWLAVGGQYLWVTNADDGTLSVIATVSRQGVDRVPLNGKPVGLTYGVDRVWVAVDLP